MSPTDQAKLDKICADGFAKLNELDAIMYGYGWVTRKNTRQGQASMFGAGSAKPHSSGPSTLINSPVPLPRMPSPSNAR